MIRRPRIPPPFPPPPLSRPQSEPPKGPPIVPPGLLIAPGLKDLPPGVTPPVLGRTVVVAPASGTVRLKLAGAKGFVELKGGEDRKSTRLNSSHANISYAVFC